MKSKLPQAQEFEKWVIEEIVPSVFEDRYIFNQQARATNTSTNA